MAGIQNLSLVFMNDNSRSARNKLANMGGIMSSSQELMQAAMPIVKEVMKSVESQPMSKEMPPSKVEMPTQNFMAGGIANIPRAAPFVLRGATEVAKKAPGILEKTVTASMNLAKAPFKRPKTFAAIGFGSYLINNYLNRADKMTNEDLGKSIAGTDEEGNVNEDNLNTVISDAGISLTTDKGDKKSTAELIAEFKRVAKNTAIADPGSFAERFGKSILTGIATDLATRGTAGKASTYTPERLRQNIISNLSTDPQVINMINQPGGQQKFNDLVTKLMKGALVNVDSTTQGDTSTKFSKGDTATGPDGQKIVFDGTKWTKA